MTNSRLWRSCFGWLALSVLLLAAAFYFDTDVHSWVKQHQTRSGKIFMRSVSRWGDWPLHVVLGFAGVAIAYFLHNRKWTVIFAGMVIACGAAGLLNPVIKSAAGRSRPSVEINAGWNGPTFTPKYHAFPSGHTIASTAFFAALVCARPCIGLFFLPIPILIAVSRVYLNAHHLSDVVAGAILGVWCAFFVWRAVAKRTDYEGLPDWS